MLLGLNLEAEIKILKTVSIIDLWQIREAEDFGLQMSASLLIVISAAKQNQRIITIIWEKK